MTAGGRRVLVTGAGSGIGLACALELSRRGFSVAGSVRSGARAAAVRRAAAEAGVRVETVLLDVTDARACERVVSRLRPWGLVNNAGLPVTGAVEDVGDSEARAALETMVVAPVRLARLAIPHMQPLARALAASGRRDEALAVASELVEIGASLPDPSMELTAAAGAVATALQLGEPERAAALAARRSGRIAGQGEAGEWHVTLGLLRLQAGRAEEAVEHVRRALDGNPPPGLRANASSVLALACVAAGRAEEAEAALRRCESAGGGTYLDRALVAVTRGLLEAVRGGEAEAEEAFAAAAAVADATEDRLSQALVRLARGYGLKAAGSPGAGAAMAEAEARLDVLGIPAPGWHVAFSAAAGCR